MNNKIFVTLLIIFLFVQNNFSQDTTNIKRHLSFLGSDLFEGRGTGTIGGELSSKYIAVNLNKFELMPMGYENTFYQYIPMHGSRAKNDSKIIINSNRDTLHFDKDFHLYRTGGRIFTPNPIPIVFVGYGIFAPELNYNDYANVNVEGKLVLFFAGTPNFDDVNFANKTELRKYSFSDTKQKIALSKGAVGTIEIPTANSKLAWKKLRQEFYFENISLAYLPTPLFSIIINPLSVQKIFTDSQYNFNTILQMKKDNRLKSFELESKLLLKTNFARRDFVAPNVVGYLNGNDAKLKDEFIVITAHYDHLGVGFPVDGDSIYNGVLDNAIGVAALLELSKIFSENNEVLKRSVIFLFVTGEEKGLLGSRFFIERPPVASNKIIANINIDGLAVIGEFKSVVGVGANYSSLGDILSKVAINNNLIVDKIPDEFDAYESFLRSDQLAFALAGIPSILISDGLNYVEYSRAEAIEKWRDYINYRYHTPFDDLHQSINFKAVKQHIEVLYDFILQVANTNNKIKWNNDSPFQRIDR